MHTPPSPLADAFGSLRSAAQRDAAAARTRLSGVLDALLLTLLAALFGRLERIAIAWHHTHAHDDGWNDAESSEHPHSARALRRIALGLPATSSSHHADLAALGILPGWIMRGFPARGMRRTVPRPASPRHATPLPARAPPRALPPTICAPSGAAHARSFCSDIVTSIPPAPPARISPFANPARPHSGRDRP